jgi:hypothetical protein
MVSLRKWPVAPIASFSDAASLTLAAEKQISGRERKWLLPPPFYRLEKSVEPHASVSLAREPLRLANVAFGHGLHDPLAALEHTASEEAFIERDLAT